MAQYPYVAADGSELLVEGSMLSPPKIGHRLTRGGKHYRRVWALPEAKVAENFRFHSHQLPLGYKHATRWKDRHDKQGRRIKGEPQFDGIREVREMIAKARHAGETIDWD